MSHIESDPVFRFLRLMWSVDHGLHRVSKQMSAALGLTGPQRLAVRMIGRSPAITAGELSEQMHLDPSTVTGIVRRLQANGMIVRRVDPADARRTRLTLTKRGRALDRRSAGTIEAAVRRALASVGRADVDAASRVLTELTAQLNRSPRAR